VCLLTLWLWLSSWNMQLCVSLTTWGCEMVSACLWNLCCSIKSVYFQYFANCVSKKKISPKVLCKICGIINTMWKEKFTARQKVLKDMSGTGQKVFCFNWREVYEISTQMEKGPREKFCISWLFIAVPHEHSIRAIQQLFPLDQWFVTGVSLTFAKCAAGFWI
jgi:hypothetical protein